jgi:FixJ family two-component response regulator
MTPATIHIVDDDEELRNALGRLLRGEGYEVRAYASAGDFMLAQSTPPGPGCVLLDLEMPGPSGLELQKALQHWPLAPPVVFLSGRGNVASGVQAMKEGAVDFLEKPVESTALLEAVAAAVERDRAARARSDDIGDAQARYASLTAREREVLEQVVAGRLNKQIADALGITERTVKMHRAHVMEKMRVGSLAGLVHIARQLKG